MPKKYFPMPAYHDQMPVDISFVFADEKPAGKHGFLKADGDVFRFEDGTLARFWGVNFNGGANFPEHDYAEKVARRVAMSGCNIVRFHQLDAEWDSPNIYCYHKGPRVTTTRKLDPVSMDHLDYLIYCLKNEGIYVYFDMMTYRKFKSGDGVAHAEELLDSAKPYSYFDRRMIELQKEFCDQIWNRKNKYTGLLYKDDPVFVMTEITNECDVFVHRPPNKGADCPYYEQKFRELYRDWLAKNGKTGDWENDNVYALDDENAMAFRLELSRSYYREMYDYMRSIGVKIPITGTNWYKTVPALTEAQSEMDFVDGHNYFYDWRWGEDDKLAYHKQINGQESVIFNLGAHRANNRPYFVSEWDMPWPNTYRAEGPIYYAAVAALQNWTGMCIHTYSYKPELDNYSMLGKEYSSDAIAGVPYRQGIFAVWNDPAKFGLFYHAALICRRQDITPAEKKIGVRATGLGKTATDIYKTGLEVHRLARILEGEEAVGCDEVKNANEKIARENPQLLISDNGQMWRDLGKMIGGIDTPRTKILYGKLGGGRETFYAGGAHVDGMEVATKQDFGVIALSSLTDQPIEKSENMLLSTIARARNSGAAFDGDRQIEAGHAPIEAEAITATIRLRTERTDLKVWGINAEGAYAYCVPATFADGTMTFTVGEHFPCCYYLIVAE